MENNLRIVLAQLNFLVGDIEGNADKIISSSIKARDEFQADIIVFPELSLTSYPPEDLVLRPGLHQRVKNALNVIREQVAGIDMVVGYPERVNISDYNSASVIRDGQIIAHYRKQHLPNYSVFDEKRYFTSGNTHCIVDIKGIPIALTICEDLWFPDTMAQAVNANASLTISINASPFRMQKSQIREQIMAQRAREGNMPIVYVNLVGGQDELVFDGGSMIMNAQGEICQHANYFEETLMPVDIELKHPIRVAQAKSLPFLSNEQLAYKALVIGVRDYIEKNGFPGVIIGLSGGIDSALTLAIAVDAIGKDRVEGIMMPSRYTSEMSIRDAELEAKALGVHYRSISIEPIFSAFVNSLAKEFTGLAVDATEENLQARCRGSLLMAISNKKGAMVLSTGNKSEMSVGYATLYGDMVGGYCALKDVPKTLVYRLAKYRNSIAPIIPQYVIDRPPSAELAEDQKDEDNLPPYPILDGILERYIEQDQSIPQIVAAGFTEETVRWVAKKVDANEYKRRQGPPGVRITQRAFGRDRRYPITSGFGKKHL